MTPIHKPRVEVVLPTVVKQTCRICEAIRYVLHGTTGSGWYLGGKPQSLCPGAAADDQRGAALTAEEMAEKEGAR